MFVELVLLVLVLIVLWIFSKSVKQLAQLSEHRIETLVTEATQDDVKRRAKARFDTETLIKAAENTQLARMALDADPEILTRLRSRTQEPTA